MKLYAVKVMCESRDLLLNLHLGVNTYNCGPMEYVAVHGNEAALKAILARNNITLIGDVYAF